MNETDTSRSRPAYLIRKRGVYYRTDSQGYTTSVIQAGRYTLAEAKAITHPNGLDGPRDGMEYIHEDAKAGDEDWSAYRALLARAEKAEAEIERLRATLSAITATDCYSRDEVTDMARAALIAPPPAKPEAKP